MYEDITSIEGKIYRNLQEHNKKISKHRKDVGKLKNRFDLTSSPFRLFFFSLTMSLAFWASQVGQGERRSFSRDFCAQRFLNRK